MFLGVSDNPVMCAWASIRPGISVLPPTSMTAASWISIAFDDTETMRPSCTRTLNDRCGSANPSRRRLALVNSVWGIRNLSRDHTTRRCAGGTQGIPDEFADSLNGAPVRKRREVIFLNFYLVSPRPSTLGWALKGVPQA